ncbi:MAG: DUF2867 domain-containing protein [Neisseria sp.]|uniref:DUF2867 domain-containing protein n=1 Tax=Neisseria sp. TaxID=192066 RepID=UPI0026DDC7CE|nr:DUF2867 domain-containing protein [Neisseria sp.]MDO4640957.1 DUF2867 domain-containing protein [Neisseria sp.]
MDSFTVKGARVIAEPSSLDFYHFIAHPLKQKCTAIDVYKQMTSRTPGWLSLSFKIRDAVSRPFGVENIAGFDSQPGANLKVGDKLHFFTLEELSDDHIVLTAIDKHLGVMVDLQVKAAGSDGENYLAQAVTTVKTFNCYGKFYMLPVAPMHGVVMKSLFKNLE